MYCPLKIYALFMSRPKNLKANFSKPGKDGLGLYRCVVLSGPPGVGKTTAAHLVSKLEGYDVVEMNASDTRSKKLLEVGFKDTVGNHGIPGMFRVCKYDITGQSALYASNFADVT